MSELFALNREWVKKKIGDLGLHPSRANGQNFLINHEPIETILAAGDVQPGDHVLEIGPGLGALTQSLLERGARVTAIEFDSKLAAYLHTFLPDKYPHTVVGGDVLQIATPDFLGSLGPYKLIANIPYHITSDIIRRFVETPHPPVVACVLIQKEVAQRLIAQPPHMNQLALFTQWSARVEYVVTVPRNFFMPVPAVDSAIVRLTPGAGAATQFSLAKDEQKKLFSLIKRGFSHPRKQLANNLGVQKTDASFDFSRRAETLSIEEWITLQKRLS